MGRYGGAKWRKVDWRVKLGWCTYVADSFATRICIMGWVGRMGPWRLAAGVWRRARGSRDERLEHACALFARLKLLCPCGSWHSHAVGCKAVPLC